MASKEQDLLGKSSVGSLLPVALQHRSAWVRCCITLYITSRCGCPGVAFGKSQVLAVGGTRSDAPRRGKKFDALTDSVLPHRAQGRTRSIVSSVLAINKALCASDMIALIYDTHARLPGILRFPGILCGFCHLLFLERGATGTKRRAQKRPRKARRCLADGQGDCVSVCAVYH